MVDSLKVSFYEPSRDIEGFCSPQIPEHTNVPEAMGVENQPAVNEGISTNNLETLADDVGTVGYQLQVQHRHQLQVERLSPSSIAGPDS